MDLAAVIFDMDGVVTRTAALHAAAWKQLFDEYLERRARASGTPFVPFDARRDYLVHVDGRPRYDGVRAFLAARGIDLPWGDPGDGAGVETICGLGNRKDALIDQRLAQEGVAAFDSSVGLVRALRVAGVRTAVATSSKHGPEVLAAAGVAPLFDACVDGNDLERLGLPGKPEPHLFLEAARRLGIAPRAAVVIEDAVAGVEAGRRGEFGLVVGVDRHGTGNALTAAGADIVVADLGDLSVGDLRAQLARARPP